MKLSLAVRSLIIFAVSVILLVVLTLAESAMVGMSLGMERLITIVTLVLVPAVGAVFGLMSLVRKEGRALMAITAMLLNTSIRTFSYDGCCICRLKNNWLDDKRAG